MSKNKESTKEVKKISREDKRQSDKISKLVAERDRADAELGKLFDVLATKKGRDLPMIDKHLMLAQFNALESYASALDARINWESVRTRTSRGEYLNRDSVDLCQFMFGEPISSAKKQKSSKKTDKKKK